MSLLYVDSNIFSSQADVLVNPVNLNGKMGRGLALDFRRKFPDMYTYYQELCQQKVLKIGRLLWWKYEVRADTNAYVVCFPTKDKYQQPSKLWYIEHGLKRFISDYPNMKIKTAAFPRLGCGLGGLDFEMQVQPLMEKYLAPLTDLIVTIYDPQEIV